MTTKDINDLTKYSYAELEQAKMMMGAPAIAQAFPFTTKDIDAEIARRSAPAQPQTETDSHE